MMECLFSTNPCEIHLSSIQHTIKVVLDIQNPPCAVPFLTHSTGAGPAWHSNDSMSVFHPPAAVRLYRAVVFHDTAP